MIQSRLLSSILALFIAIVSVGMGFADNGSTDLSSTFIIMLVVLCVLLIATVIFTVLIVLKQKKLDMLRKSLGTVKYQIIKIGDKND